MRDRWRPGTGVPGGLLGALLLLTSPASAAPAAGGRTVALEGPIVVLQEDDFAVGRSRLRYELFDRASGRRVRLRLDAASRRGLTTGAEVALRGAERDGEVRVRSLALLPRPGGPAEAAVVGARSALVLVVDFADSTVSCSVGEVAGLMFSGAQSVDGLYRETSFDLVSFPGTAQNVARVAIAASRLDPCDPWTWADEANAAAQQAGVPLGGYQHLAYVLPSNVSCSWAGLATVGCFGGCPSWIATCQLPDVYAHELGHNLGLRHASTDTDDDGAVDCEYCDRSDFMGIGGVGWRQVNGPHKLQMGWLPPSQVESASGAGSTVVLSALDIDPLAAAFPQLLRIDPPGGASPYWVSYRRRAGYDSTLETTYVNGVGVHRQPDASGNTLLVATLGDGESFADGAGEVSLTQVSHDGSTATLLVGTSCAIDEPQLAVAPGAGTGLPGQTLSYAIDLLNGDDPGCPPATFDLGAGVPAGWTAIVYPAAVTLAPGESASASLVLRSATDAADGAWSVDLTADDPARADHGTSATLDYVVQDVALTAPSGLEVAALRGRHAVLRWTAGQNALAHRVYRDGAPLGTTESTVFVDWLPVGGAPQYQVTAIDAAGRESAPSASVALALPPDPKSFPVRRAGPRAPERSGR